MKKLSTRQLKALGEKVRLTRAQECNCAAFLTLLPELLEAEGIPGVSARLEAGRHHRRLCDECREHYDVLKRVIHQGPGLSVGASPSGMGP